jgi:hypothetical protein
VPLPKRQVPSEFRRVCRQVTQHSACHMFFTTVCSIAQHSLWSLHDVGTPWPFYACEQW